MATVLEVPSRGMTVTHGNDSIAANTECVLKLRLRVEADSVPAFEVHERFRFSQFALPVQGQQIAVVFDPDDHDEVILDPTPGASLAAVPAVAGTAAVPAAGMDLTALLSTVRDAQAKSGGDRHAMAEMLRAQLGGGAVIVDGSGPAPVFGGAANPFMPAAPPAQQQDPIELLATLSELRDKGVVTPEEFDAQKRRILGE
jgi:hypothetical protein